jgi:phosphonate transport system substrate-binding protein
MKHGYHVFAKMGDDDDFRGLILVRTDARINRISDLKGKIVSYPAPTALAATLMPQYYLQTHGLNINTDIENIYVGSQESSIMNVLNRKVAAGATWTVPWRVFVRNQPQLAEQLEVKWETESFVNNSWMAKENTPQAIIEKLNAILLNLPQTPEGQAILTAIPLSKFEVANDETYKPIQAFVVKFDKTVRPLK